MRATTAGGGLWVGLILIVGCRGILGVDGYGDLPAHQQNDAAPPGYIGTNDGVRYVSKICRDCVDTNCSSQARTCAQEPACAAMATCLALCDSSENYKCRGQCNLSIPRTPEFADVVACEANACKDCPASRVVRGGLECDKCLANRCAGPVDALSQSATALHFDTCKKDCSTASVAPSGDGGVGAADCSCAASGDVAPVDDVNQCATGSCNAACNVAVDWSCLGHVKWPEPAGGLAELELHLNVVDATNFSSPLFSSFAVRACSPIDPECGSPLATADGANGRATLSIKAGAFENFFEHLLITSTDPADALLYFYPPMRRSPSWSERRIVTQGFAKSTVARLPGVTLDWTTKGGIVWSVKSCVDQPPFAEGVTVSASQQAPDSGSPDVPVYYFDAQGNLGLAKATSALGIGAIINANPGAWMLSASTDVAGKRLNVGSYPLKVLLGKITHVTMAPAPAKE